MSSTPEPGLVLRDDLAVPAEFDGEVPPGATVLVAQRADAPNDEPVGLAVVGGSGAVRTLNQLWVRPGLRRRGWGRRVLELVTARETSGGTRVLGADVPAQDPAPTALAHGTRVLGQQLEKPLDREVTAPPVLGWRELSPDEFATWCETQVQAYAGDNLERSGGDAALALERSRADFVRLLPNGQQTPDTSLVLLTADGGRVGHLWVRHHHRQPNLSYVFDVEVAERHRGRGFGRAAMVLAEVLAREAGDERIGLHVFGGNKTALGLYLTQGYRVRSTSHDLLARA